jgi:hypothetical protein
LRRLWRGPSSKNGGGNLFAADDAEQSAVLLRRLAFLALKKAAFQKHANTLKPQIAHVRFQARAVYAPPYRGYSV